MVDDGLGDNVALAVAELPAEAMAEAQALGQADADRQAKMVAIRPGHGPIETGDRNKFKLRGVVGPGLIALLGGRVARPHLASASPSAMVGAAAGGFST